MDIKDELNALALVGGVVAFVVALYQYRVAQRWKRAEWVATEMRSFLDDPWVRVACSMVDWGSRRVHLPPAADQEVLVTDDEIRAALVHHRERPNGFSPKEALIRDTFDRFLDGFERCSAHVRSRLVDEIDLAPYLSYWAFHIQSARAGDTKVERLVQLKAFARDYGYSGAMELIEKLAMLHTTGPPNKAQLQTDELRPADNHDVSAPPRAVRG
jgi:hypothetical protein